MKLFGLTTITSILAALAVVSADAAEPAIASPDSAVVKLTADTFESFVKENPLVLAEFFAPWCGHCKRLGPEFSAAADKLVEKDIKLAQIDCTEERDLCSAHGIKGYPTLKVFRGPGEPIDYQGQREQEAIVSQMIKLSLPAVSVIEDSADLLDTIAEVSDSLVLQVVPKGAAAEANQTFYEIANDLRNDFVFVSTSNDDYVSKYVSKSSKKPAYVVFRNGEKIDDASPYTGETISETELKQFINVETKPLFGEISGGTFKSYMEAGLPLAYYFWDEESQRAGVADTITELAKKYRGEINFVGLEAKKYGAHAKNLNMEEKFPLFVIHDLAGNLKYGISQEGDLDNKEIGEFVEKYSKGELKPIVKSEPIPEVQEEAVYHLVGHTHEEITKQGKDVLVEYYAPWCGHCKRLAPTYEELAAIYGNNTGAKDKVVVAKIDHTANDVSGVDITGYPTIVLYPGDGSESVVYEGPRSLEALSAFIKEKGSHGVDALALRELAEEVEEEAAEGVAHDEL